MEDDSLTFRPAEPTIEDGLVFARYLDMAAEGFMRLLLGRRAPGLVAQAFTRPDNEYSFENVIFAEEEERIFGMAAGFSAEQRRGFTDKPLKEAEGFPAGRMMIIGTLFAPLRRILSTVPDGHFYLLALAVDRESRGSGLGTRLIDLMAQRARDEGSARLTLDVAVKNEGARQLYQRLGFAARSRWPKSRVVSPVLIRLSRPL